MAVDFSGAAGLSPSRRVDVARVIASALNPGAATIPEPLGLWGLAALPGGISGTETSGDVVQPVKSKKQSEGTEKLRGNFMGKCGR